jgi:hypothetical protein
LSVLAIFPGISGTLGLGGCLIALGLGVTRILGTGRNAALLDEVKAIAPDRIDVLPIGTRPLREWALERTGGEGADILIDALGPGAPAESMLEAISALRRGGIAVDIGSMMERPGLDLFAMMCSQITLIGSLWFSSGEAQDMAALAGAGALDLSYLEHHTFPSARSTRHSTTSPNATAASPTSSASPDRHAGDDAGGHGGVSGAHYSPHPVLGRGPAPNECGFARVLSAFSHHSTSCCRSARPRDRPLLPVRWG